MSMRQQTYHFLRTLYRCDYSSRCNTAWEMESGGSSRQTWKLLTAKRRQLIHCLKSIANCSRRTATIKVVVQRK